MVKKKSFTDLTDKINPSFNLIELKCPEGLDYCETNPIKFRLDYSYYYTLSMIISGVVGGLALGIALLLETPIKLWIASLNITDNQIIIALLTAGVYFLVAILFVAFAIVPINRKMNKVKKFAEYNEIVL